jgi:hypothetical protein
VVERLVGNEQNFRARIARPPIARAYVVISAVSEDEAGIIGDDVASRQATRVLGALAGRDLMQYLSFSADAARFDSYRHTPSSP